ncbi:MAG: LysR family transcriptional regulator [Rhizobiales bacterium]|nr:LysR family transcriptional regulator [Hyphomicrobiales bacterium]
MPRRDLPPLRALTAFEAAARLGSFRMAANELGITRSAVSHQVKGLEQRLGVQLFRRDARRAELTQLGQAYYPPVRDAFDQIETQTRAIRPPAGDNELKLQVYVTVALKWLIPRLHDFERRFPEMKVRLSTSYFDWDFDDKNVDAGFILARNKMPEHYYRPLFNSLLTPVCAPSRVEGAGRAELAGRFEAAQAALCLHRRRGLASLARCGWCLRHQAFRPARFRQLHPGAGSGDRRPRHRHDHWPLRHRRNQERQAGATISAHGSASPSVALRSEGRA